MRGSTKVQIYLGAADLADVTGCVEAGADFIGLVADEKIIGDPGAGGTVLPSLNEVEKLFAAIQDRAMTVALTFDNDVHRIAVMARRVHPRVIHLAGNGMLPIMQIMQLKKEVPGVKIMQAIAVNRPNPLQIARHYQSVCDYFLLDSKGHDGDHPYGVGATGQTHDWDISAELVRGVNIPVILAGGLHATNVRNAIAQVAPWGVDSFTLTNMTPDRESRKDLRKVRDFISNTKAH